jgi:hypothetical protein
MRRAFQATTGGVSATLAFGAPFSASVDLQSRGISYSDEFRLRGNVDGRTTLVRSIVRSDVYRGALRTDVFYEFSRQQSSRFERRFVRVQPGTGQYRYTGDVNGNGVADEEEFEQVRFDGDHTPILIPGEQFLPVSVVRASGRVRTRPGLPLFPSLLDRFSFETTVRVEEKSSDPRTANVAFLNLNTFLRSASTLGGSQTLQQDIHLDEHSQALSVRARVSERRGLTRLVSASEDAYGNERSVRFRGRFDRSTLFTADVYARRDRMMGDSLSIRTRDLVIGGGLLDVGYRLDREWEAGVLLGVFQAENILPGRTGIATSNEQAVRLVYGVPSRGSVRLEMKREDVLLRVDLPATASRGPYEMTDGRQVGITWLWNVHADIALTELIQLTAFYSGRLERSSPVVHTARIEARAVF